MAKDQLLIKKVTKKEQISFSLLYENEAEHDIVTFIFNILSLLKENDSMIQLNEKASFYLHEIKYHTSQICLFARILPEMLSCPYPTRLG